MNTLNNSLFFTINSEKATGPHRKSTEQTNKGKREKKGMREKEITNERKSF